jgi:catechol 2,3-dioxygenase-like lactoylglutathione lyase family enzyme
MGMEAMRIRHIGLVCRREADADRFFGEFLGLEKSERKTLPVSLARPLFGLDGGIDVCNYTGDGMSFEVFFQDDPKDAAGRIIHACLEVGNADALLDRARAMNITVLRVPKGEGWVTFIEDADGHRFEIKKA